MKGKYIDAPYGKGKKYRGGIRWTEAEIEYVILKFKEKSSSGKHLSYEQIENDAKKLGKENMSKQILSIFASRYSSELDKEGVISGLKRRSEIQKRMK